MRYITGFLIALAAVYLCSCTHQNDDKIIGVKIYDYQGNYNKLAGKWKEMGELDSARMDIVTRITGRKAGI